MTHDGQVYTLSPYDLVRNEDGYYIFGWSETHGKVVKFRVDRICNQENADAAFRETPDDYDIASFCCSVFSMYDGELHTVELKCEKSTMNAVISRFGEDVHIEKIDRAHYRVFAEVCVSSTFFAWVVSFGGKVEITAPEEVREEFIKGIRRFLSDSDSKMLQSLLT